MIRIVGIQRDSNPLREFVLLQHQAPMRTMLRGHAVMTDDYISGKNPSGIFAFTDLEYINASQFIMIRSGVGESRWSATKDGGLIYTVFTGRSHTSWSEDFSEFHVLHTQHSYTERQVSLELVH